MMRLAKVIIELKSLQKETLQKEKSTRSLKASYWFFEYAHPSTDQF